MKFYFMHVLLYEYLNLVPYILMTVVSVPVMLCVCVCVCLFVCNRWRMSGMQNCNPEQIMLSAVTRRSSRDVNIMKEKLIFSGAASENNCLACNVLQFQREKRSLSLCRDDFMILPLSTN